MEWLAFFSQPITQIGGIAGLFIALHKTGIIDVRAVIRSGIGIDSGVRDINGDTRNALQLLLTKMEDLTRYANHDTTENIERVHKGLEILNGKMDTHIRQHDKMEFILEDIKENGVKCRKE